MCRQQPATPPFLIPPCTGMAVRQSAGDLPSNGLPVSLIFCCLLTQTADSRIRDLQLRLDSTEARQNTIVNFLARVAQNPTVLQQMVSVAQSAGLQRLSSGRSGGELAAYFRHTSLQCHVAHLVAARRWSAYSLQAAPQHNDTKQTSAVCDSMW